MAIVLGAFHYFVPAFVSYLLICWGEGVVGLEGLVFVPRRKKSYWFTPFGHF